MQTRHLNSLIFCLLVALGLQTMTPGLVLAQRLRRPTNTENQEQQYNEPAEQQRLLPAFTSNTVTLPAGTLIITQMLTPISSKTAQPGDRIRAKVIVPVTDKAGRTLIPVGSNIEGQVQDVLRAKSRRRSGMIEVSFDRLRLADGQPIPLQATLAPATAEDRQRVGEDGRLTRKGSNTKRTVAFIGGGAGAGALIGSFTAGALLGAGVGAGVGVVAVLMAKGKEAVVEPGMKIGAELLAPIQLNSTSNRSDTNDSRLVPYDSRANTSTSSNNNDPSYDPRETVPRAKESSDLAYNPVETVRTTKPIAKPTPRPTGVTTKPATKAGTSTTGRVPVKDTEEPIINRADLELVNVTYLQAERGSDDTVRISITGQTPTAGWRLAPESTLQNGVLQIKLLGAPPRGIATQVISSANTVVVKADPNREIQRVTVRGATTTRTTVPIVRGEKNTNGSTTSSSENISAMGLRIADKSDALLEDYARSLRAWKQSDGRYSFEDPRYAGTPEAQLLHSFDHLSESANVFRGSLTSDAKRNAVRGLVNANKQVDRLWPFVKVSVEFKQRWQDIQRDANQLAATVPNLSSGPINPNQPSRPRS